MRRTRAALYAAALIASNLAVLPAAAQDREGGRRRMRPALGEDAPKVGDTLPDVTVYNDAGEPMKFTALDGQFRVIVFGCLT